MVGVLHFVHFEESSRFAGIYLQEGQ